MSYPEWLLREGWNYWWRFEGFAPALLLAIVWLAASLYRKAFRKPLARQRRSVASLLPIVVWAVLAWRQAINASAIDMAGPAVRYPIFWTCVASSALAGAIVCGTWLAADRVLASPGPTQRLSLGALAPALIAWNLTAAVWIGVFVREASLNVR